MLCMFFLNLQLYDCVICNADYTFIMTNITYLEGGLHLVLGNCSSTSCLIVTNSIECEGE